MSDCKNNLIQLGENLLEMALKSNENDQLK